MVVACQPVGFDTSGLVDQPERPGVRSATVRRSKQPGVQGVLGAVLLERQGGEPSSAAGRPCRVAAASSLTGAAPFQGVTYREMLWAVCPFEDCCRLAKKSHLLSDEICASFIQDKAGMFSER